MIYRHANLTQIFVRSMLVFLLALLPLYVCAASEAGATSETTESKAHVFPAATAKFSAGSVSSPVNANRMTQLAIGLFIVLICILALAWLARRFNRLQSTPDGSLRLLGGLSMGARERVVLIQVGTKQLLLGVAPGRINTLHVLDETIESMSGLSPLSTDKGFAEKLSAAISRNK